MNISSLHIDNLNFAKKGERLEGWLDLSACPRLGELLLSQASDGVNEKSLSSTAAKIDVLLQGKVDAQGRSWIRAEIKANLSTYCQRCFEPLPLSLALNFSYLIAETDQEAGDELALDDNDEYDLQEPDKAMSVAALIEDELIMALPIAPVHDFDCVELTRQAGEKPNPFAALKDLMKKP